MALVNGRPRFVPLGTKDVSTRPIPVEPLELPIHLPKFFPFTAAGVTGPVLCANGEFEKVFKTASFDEDSPFYTHVTKFIQTVVGQGNAVVIDRIVPSDNTKLANVTIYLDVVEDSVDVYKRNSDGSIAYDDNGNPIVDQSDVSGLRVKVIAEVSDFTVGQELGQKSIKTGYMTDSNGNSSTMYPIKEFVAMAPGAFYNNIGVAFDLPTADEVTVDYLEALQAIPYYLYIVDKSTGVPVFTENALGSIRSTVVLKDKAKDPVTNMNITIPYNVANWEEKDIYGNIGGAYVYYDNLNTVLAKAIAVEKPYIGVDVTTNDGETVNTAQWMDFIIGADDSVNQNMIAIFTGYSTKRVPYFTIQIDDSSVSLPEGSKEVSYSKDTPIYLGGGIDGTLTLEELEKGVVTKLKEYADPNSKVQNLARNPESIFYDSGFTLDTKKEFANVIAIRKDTFVALSTYTFGEKPLSLDQEIAVGLALKSRLELVPESTFFNTPVARAIIFAGSGELEVARDGVRWPLLLDIAKKAAAMMGGSKWNPNKAFFKGEDNKIEDFIRITPDSIPDPVKDTLWKVGVNYPEPDVGDTYFWPAMQTIYPDDTSVLNNFTAAMALTYVVKVAAAAWRKFTGATDLTPDMLIDSVEKFMSQQLNDAFGGIIKVVPEAYLTEYDKATGFSWNTKVKLYANNMYTVNTMMIEADRLAELAQ